MLGRIGKLDALAKCTLLETLNLSYCNGYDYAADKRVSEGLTGTWHRSLTAETTNANLLTPLVPLPTAPPRVARTARQMHRSRHTRLGGVHED